MSLTANSSAEMFALQRLDILDLKSLDVQIIQTQQSNSIIQIETQAESMDEICALLQSSSIIGEPACAQLDILVLGVDSALQLEVLDQRRVHLGPCVLQGSPAVRRYGDFAGFGADVGVCGLLGCEEWLRVDGHGCVFGGLGGILDGGGVGGADEHLVVFVVGYDGSLVQVLSDFLGRGSLEGGRCRHDGDGPGLQTTGLSICVVSAIRFCLAKVEVRRFVLLGGATAEAQKDGSPSILFLPQSGFSTSKSAKQAQGGQGPFSQSLLLRISLLSL